MKKINMKNIFLKNLEIKNCILLIALVLIDQISKNYLIAHLPEYNYNITLTSFLDIKYAWNYGISFGLFDGAGRYGNIFFGILNSLILSYLFYLAQTSDDKLEKYAYIIISAGAIGNLIDRAIHGAVFDFILIHYGDLRFAIFNFADSFVSFGVFLAIIANYYNKK